MAEDFSQDRTEKPTPKRRQEAHREGRIARSRDLSTALVLFTALWITVFWAPWAAGRAQEMLRFWLSRLEPGRVSPAGLSHLGVTLSHLLATLLAPVFLGLVFASLAAAFLQGGWLFSTRRLFPDFSRLNPLSGFKKLLSGAMVLELARALAKMAAIASIAFLAVRSSLAQVPELLLLDPLQLGGLLKAKGLTVAWPILLALLVLGGLDYLHQRHRFEKGLMMTKQEVKEEMRQTEGDPRVKARMRTLLRQLATKRMMAEVPKADVVITNPTHLAVALKYDGAVMPAPQVVAKGQGFVALKIMALAQEAGVAMIQNRELARALYKTVEVGELIPTSLYRAVAEVLAYVYSLRAAAGGRR